MKSPFALLAVFVFLLTADCLLPIAFGQSTNATLSGTVMDERGAVIPGAQITVTNPATTLERQVVTNESGSFTVNLLPPSTYTVTVESKGFATLKVAEVVLNVGDQKSLQIHLKAGNVNEMVQVNADAPLINESAAVATVVDRQFVENLPLNGRSFQSLITLTPGVVVSKTTGQEQGQFSVNGQRANANYFTVDGVSANAAISAGGTIGQLSGGSLPALSAAGGTNNLVSVDALQEFRVQTSTYAAEFGRTPGAQVQIVTRSGTNEFRGTLFEYFRNDALDANDWFANSRRLPKPALRQNDFGFVLGGPIFLPRFGEGGDYFYNGRDKTFFFFSYEGLRLRQPLIGITDVPSLTARQTAVERIRPFLNAFPVPTGPERANGLAEFASSFSNPSTLNATSIRIDHNISDKLTIFGRYNYAPSSSTTRGSAGFAGLNTVGSTSYDTQTLTVGATMSVNPSISNDFRANYTQYDGNFVNVLDDFGGATVPDDSILFPSFASGQNSLFSFRISASPTTSFQVGTTAANQQRQINLVDNFSVITGSHQLRFGVDYRRLFPIVNIINYGQTAIFNTVALAVAGTASAVGIGARQGNVRPLVTNLSLYGQDTWRVTSRLTLTYGLRWEVNPPPTEQNGNDQFAVTGLDNPLTLTLAPRGTPIYRTTYNNFAPRIGAAYQLSQRAGRESVLRGGFGVFYDLGNTQATTPYGNSYPYAASRNLSNVSFPLSTTNALPPVFDLNARPISSIFAFDPELKLPYTYQWNLAVEQSLGSNQVVSASYVAALGRRLLRQETFTGAAVNPQFAFVFAIRNAATSDYHAMQLQYHRRLSRGLQAIASYTWSHSIDNASNDSAIFTPANRLDPQLDRGPSDFDVRHSLTGAVTYNLPTPKIGKVGRIFLGGWSVDTIFTARTATPVNVRYTRNIGFGSYSFRPDLVPGIPLYIDDPAAPGGRRFNDARVTIPGNPNPQIGPFLRPVEARQGTLGRNALRGFPVYQIDFALRRQFNLTERFNIQLKAEAFNLFNHPNFADPDGVLTSTTFGQSTSMLGRSLGSGGITGGFNPLYQIGGPRSIQLSAKVQF